MFFPSRLMTSIQNWLSQQYLMAFIGQVQNRSGKKYSYCQTQQLSRYYREEGREQTTAARSTDVCIPSAESTHEDLSQDLLREVTLKNEILMEQLSQYKRMVEQLQNRISHLQQQNKDLLQQTSKQKSEKWHHRYQKEEHKSTTPLRDQTQNSQAFFSLSQIHEILGGYADSAIGGAGLSKNGVVCGLIRLVEEGREMEQFVESVWRMKDRIEPGNQELLGQLWEWLKIVAANYQDLLSYNPNNHHVHSPKPRKGVAR